MKTHVPLRAGLLATLALSAFAGSSAGSFSIDPAVPEAYLKAINTDELDQFGFAAAISGDTLVIGAPREGSAATGVDGDDTDNSLFRAGAAYVYVRDGATWTFQAYLKASNAGESDGFGSAVAIRGDTIVVGAPFESSAATGVDGDALDDSASLSGAAYVFVREVTTWSQQAYLKASNSGPNDEFGSSVAIGDDTIVVASSREASAATGVNGDQHDESALGAGAAYVFVRDGTTWSQQAYLKASNTGSNDGFARSVAVSQDTLIIGARGEDSAATGIDGDQTDNSASSAGAAYVFVRSGTSWSQQAYLKGSNTEANDEFGTAVAISGDRLVVGAAEEASAATGVDGDESDDSENGSGAAYVFVRDGMSWSQEAYLKASNTDGGDFFGSAVALAGDFLVVGAPEEDSSATGVDGDQGNTAGKAGAAYLFARDASGWSQAAYLKASNTGSNDEFGIAVGVSGDTVVVGAHREDSSAVGVNGVDPLDDSADSAGSAYVFDVELAFVDIGYGLAGVSGEPVLVGRGDLSSGSPTEVNLTNAAPNAPGLLFLAVDPITPVPFKLGTLAAFPFFALMHATAGLDGSIELGFTWLTGVPSDLNVYFQWAFVDATAPAGVALSNAIRGTTE